MSTKDPNQRGTFLFPSHIRPKTYESWDFTPLLFSTTTAKTQLLLPPRLEPPILPHSSVRMKEKSKGSILMVGEQGMSDDQRSLWKCKGHVYTEL